MSPHRLDPPPLPADFERRMRALLGGEADAFLRAVAAPAAGLRVNTLRLSPERFREIAPFSVEPLPFPPSGFLVDPGARPGRHPYHAAGLYYLQDPGAMAVAALVGPRPGERVLDVAAAPGGKSTHLAALMEDRGVLVANDVHAGRARELAGNLERCGVRRALVTNETVARLAARFGATFDRVLLDAPCSGESMFHKSDAAREEWSEAVVAGCARRQGDLLGDAAACVRPGGLLVYSTCTFSPEENEAVIGAFLRAHPDFAVERRDGVPGTAAGRPEWVAEEARAPGLEGTVRLWPHRVPGAGHFVAALRRAGDGAPEPGGFPGASPPPPVARAWEALATDLLGGAAPLDGRLSIRGTELFLLPPDAPDPGRLRVERPGWWVGSVQKNRVDPAHALAMGLRPGEASRVLELAADDPRTAAYLRGETLEAPGEGGWLLVTVEGHPLGWGKRVGRTVKNHLPKGLRWRQAADRG